MKIVLTTIFMTALIGILTLSFRVQTVQASGTIYIRGDGSIDSPTAPISTSDYVTYTFTGNIYDSIVVERDNIVVDAAGYTVQKTESDTGITLQGRINVTIRNSVIKGFGLGIGLYSSNRCTLYGNRLEGDSSGPGIGMIDSNYNNVLNNTLLDNDHSIHLGQSSNNVIDGNNASYNHQGITVESFSHNNTVTNNTANNNTGGGNGIYVNEGSSNNLIANNILSYNGHGVTMTENSSGNVIMGNTLIGNKFGVDLHFYAPDNLIVGNTISSNWQRGVSIVGSPGNRIIGNNITNNTEVGIGLSDSGHNEILGNTLSSNGHSIWLANSSNNLVDGNNASYNQQGISMGGFCNNNTIAHNVANYNNGGILVSNNSSNNLVIDNEFSYNRLTAIMIAPNSSENVVKGNTVASNGNGIEFWGNSVNNIVYHNNFLNNTEQTTSREPINAWDNGAEGNYWSDYADVDSNHDGIGDTVHVIEGNNTDRYPLMGMFSDFIATSEHHIQIICNSSVSNFGFNWTGIIFDVAGKDNTTGFCRICISTDLINETYRIFVNRTEVQYSTLSCSNTTHKYLYFNYTHPGEKVLIINTKWYRANALAGDVDRDMKVDVKDLLTAIASFGSRSGDPKWDPYSDVTGDGTVDIKDFATIVRHFGEHYP